MFQVQQGFSKIFLRVLHFFKASAIKQTFRINGEWLYTLHVEFFSFWGLIYVAVYPQQMMSCFIARSVMDFTFDVLSLMLYI